jgi:peptide/nickel transport system substrate-binding protein
MKDIAFGRRALGAAAIGGVLADRAAAQPAAQPRYGGTLICVLPDEPPTLATWLSSSFLPRMVAPQMVEGLLDHDPDLTPRPLLAESFEVSPDGLTYTFRLRQGVRFHDGRPFTADDVVFSANEIWLKHLPDARTRWTAVGLRVEKVDDFTVLLRLNKPYVYATSYLSSHFAPVIPKHLFENTDIPRNPVNARPVGTGPFRFAEYVRGSHIAMDRNPNYWRRDAAGRPLPYLDRVVMRIMPDATARTLAMTKREIDYQNYPGFPVESVPALRAAGISIGAEPVAGIARIQRAFLNVRTGPLADARVRRALHHALDRRMILERAGYGFGVVSVGPLHQENPAYAGFLDDATPRYGFDPALAQRLLDEAGFPRAANGQRFTLRFHINRGLSIDAAIAELMRDQFAAVGIALDIQRVDEATRLNIAGRKATDMTMFGGVISGPSPDSIQHYWLSANKDSTQGMTGFAGIEDPELDRLVDAGQRIADPAERRAAWQRFQRRFVEQAYELPLFDVQIVSAWNPDFVGLPQKVWGHYDAHTFIWWTRGRAR